MESAEKTASLILVIISAGCCVKYFFGAYFGNRNGKFRNITENSNKVENVTFMENGPTGYLNGWKSKLLCNLLNTRFGQKFMLNMFLKGECQK